MTAIDRCPLLNVDTGLCKGITWNPFGQPSHMDTGAWTRGMCKARGSIATQVTCSKHPQRNEWIEATADDGTDSSKRLIVSKR